MGHSPLPNFKTFHMCYLSIGLTALRDIDFEITYTDIILVQTKETDQIVEIQNFTKINQQMK